MNLFTKPWRTLALAAVLVVGAAYGQTRPTVLVGQWVSPGGTKMELFADGTGVYGNGVSVTWSVQNNRFIRRSWSGTMAFDYKISGYKLILSTDDEGSDTLVRKEKWEEYNKKREEEKQIEAERVKQEKLREEEREENEERQLKLAEEQRFEKISRYFTDSRDGQKYRAVKIGGKVWMAHNLNFQTGNSECYGDVNSNCDKYGRAYDWNTAKTVCPAGWHLPSREEWSSLKSAAGGNGVAGKKLKSTYGWYKDGDGTDEYGWNKDGNGTDEYGFSALPGGYRGLENYGIDINPDGYGGGWWTATEYNDYYAYSQYVTFRSNDLNEKYFKKNSTYSVRCVKD